jgi:NMD protein affecting ribosome stability and mRNA decay
MIPGKFCPNCGRQNVDFYKGFCIECYSKMHKFTKVPKKYKVVKCRKCGMWLYKRDWIQDSFRNLERMMSEKVKTELFYPKISMDMEDENKAIVTVKGFVDRQGVIPLEQQFTMDVEYEKNRLCDNCLKSSGKYKELIIQLRRDDDPKDSEKFGRVETFIKKQTHKMMFREANARVFSFKDVQNGVDFIYGSKEIGNNITKMVKQKYHIKFTKATKFRGIRRGEKDIEYTYCFRA